MMSHRLPLALAAVRFLLAVLLPTLSPAAPRESGSGSRPNVLMIAIDDLNDWVGCLDSHPMVQTPHIDRLAGRGTLFANAHAQAPLCNPSRTSLMLSLRPSTTGIYGLAPWFRGVEPWSERVSLSRYFAEHGYRTYGTGKIFHGHYVYRDHQRGVEPAEFHVMGPAASVGARPEEKLIPPTPMGNHPLMDWGVFPHKDEDKGDYHVASWAVERIAAMPKDEPFFLAAGFFLPHVPCYATQKWFDLYPDDDSVLPPMHEDDRADTPRFSWYIHWELPEPRLSWCRENNQWRNLTRSYLACISFVDSQVGRILDALDEAGLSENTIVVLWSDHGYHLGEKSITGKNTLWARSTHVPLIFAGPGVTPEQLCTRPAELLDIYPTLVDLCGLPARDDLEGHSLTPQLADAAAPRPYPAITTHNRGNHAVRSERWRYIQYADGTEELYDVENDPNEWTNLADDPRYDEVLAEHRRWLPTIDRPLARGSRHRTLSYDPATDTATWQGEPVTREMAIPE